MTYEQHVHEIFNRHRGMLKRASRHNVLSECLTIAAIIEIGGVIIPGAACPAADGAWYSEPLAHLRAYEAAYSVADCFQRELGVDSRRFTAVKDLRDLLAAEALSRGYRISSSGSTDAIVDSIVAGMKHYIFRISDGLNEDHGVDWHSTTSKDVRRLASDTRLKHYVTASDEHGAEFYRYIVGVPVDGGTIQMATFVSLRHFEQVLADMARVERGVEPYYDGYLGMVRAEVRVTCGRTQSLHSILDRTHVQAPALFASWLLEETLWQANHRAKDDQSDAQVEAMQPCPVAPGRKPVAARCLSVHDLLPNQERHAAQALLGKIIARNARTLRRMHGRPATAADTDIGVTDIGDAGVADSACASLEKFYRTQLCGAFSIDDVSNLAVLILPEPQSALAA